MSKFFAAVSPLGEIKFESISAREGGVVIDASEVRYGGWRVLAVNMRPFKGNVSALSQSGASLWDDHAVAWVWQHMDGSYWMDALSLSEADVVAWSTSPSRSEAMGMKVVPVQFTCNMTALQKSENVRMQISNAKERGDFMAEAVWTRCAKEMA